MLIPLGTDAPVYHWPIVTVAIMVATVAASIGAWTLAPETTVAWNLVYGEGLHPIQWLSWNFLHGGIGHLIGNLIYLWIFGIVVEGKVGGLGFLAIYLGLGVVEGAIVQALMLRIEPGHSALGASGVICGLIGMGLVWAPRNEVSLALIVFWRFMPRFVTFELPVVAFAVLYFLWQIVDAGIGLAVAGRWIIGTGLLHLFGAVLGFVLATILVKTDRVDCEGWDVYSRGASGRAPVAETGRRKRSRKRKKRRGGKSAASKLDFEARSTEALGGLRAAIQDGAALEALGCYHDLQRMPEGWRPVEPDVLKLIGLLQRGGFQAESQPVMVDYLERFGDAPGAARVRLKLARMLLTEERPAKALRVLKGVSERDLPEELRGVRRKLESEAQRMRAEGVLELDDP